MLLLWLKPQCHFKLLPKLKIWSLISSITCSSDFYAASFCFSHVETFRYKSKKHPKRATNKSEYSQYIWSHTSSSSRKRKYPYDLKCFGFPEQNVLIAPLGSRFFASFAWCHQLVEPFGLFWKRTHTNKWSHTNNKHPTEEKKDKREIGLPP